MGKNLFARFFREKDPPKTSGNVCCGWLPPVYFLPSHLTRYWSPGSPASLHQCHPGEPTRICIKDAISNDKSSSKKWWPMAYGSLVVYERNDKLSKRKWTWSFKRSNSFTSTLPPRTRQSCTSGRTNTWDRWTDGLVRSHNGRIHCRQVASINDPAKEVPQLSQCFGHCSDVDESCKVSKFLPRNCRTRCSGFGPNARLPLVALGRSGCKTFKSKSQCSSNGSSWSRFAALTLENIWE